MIDSLFVVILCTAAYLLGSVNTAVLVARSRGVDIYAAGSGNPGASNAYRTMGKGAAALVYVGDLLKGFAPALIGLLALGDAVAFAAGFFAVVGHCYPLYHRFKGGKGVATAGGALLATIPLVVAGMLVVYLIIVRTTKISSLGSLTVAVLAVPAAILFGVRGWALGWFALTILLVFYRHRGNIARLLGGRENKMVTS
jgi:glycerol-3-phosphate acyltransferase PlsY